MEDRRNSWAEISLTDLFFAFRKAKVDSFYETSIRVCEKFTTYESQLGDNLTALLQQIHQGGVWTLLEEGIGSPILFPKKLAFNEEDSQACKHAFFSDAKRAFGRLTRHPPTPEFRMIGNFSVECHILSALWVNLIGHRIDACLSPNALASRVRRYRPTKIREKLGAYHLEAIGSFEPYFEPYRKWRDGGLEAIKQSLESDRPVIAMTLDVGNFYHRIDPAFFADKRFLGYLGLKLNPFEKEFTDLFANALNVWSNRCRDKMKSLGCEVSHGGLPIGLPVVRLVSNALLSFLDEEIESNLDPIYYARYVDDIFLVIRDHDRITSQELLWEHIQLRVPAFAEEDSTGDMELRLPPWGGETNIRLQSSKQKCFFLSGRSGLDLLAHIASQIRDVSSERRLMPMPEHLAQSEAAKALAATNSTDDADNLRRADGLTLRRLGWSVLLRSVAALARDLLPKDWMEERNDFYEFAHEHVIRPDKLLEQIDHLPRLFSIAVSLRDWRQALRMFRETLNALGELEEMTASGGVKINGCFAKTVHSAIWIETREQVTNFFREAFLRALPLDAPQSAAKAFEKLAAMLEVEVETLASRVLAIREADWARVPYREHLRIEAKRHAPSKPGESQLYNRYIWEEALREFLTRSSKAAGLALAKRLNQELPDAPFDSMLPFLFPTRPYTAEEIALYLPEDCVNAEPVAAANAWASYTRAVRGVWVRSDLADELLVTEADDENDLPPQSSSVGRVIRIDGPDRGSPNGDSGSRRVRLGITSFSVSDRTWDLAARGTPDLSPGRYAAIADLVNRALREKFKPDYLLMPELSIPEQWIPTVAGRLKDAGISLIAGLDYKRHAGDRIDSSAVLVLDDHRLGYRSSLQIRQRKAEAAPAEEEALHVKYHQSWLKDSEPVEKPVYVHNGFYFGVLVCSELQNVGYRMKFQGRVDCMMVLSWNRDLDTFAALVDSAAFDVHAYIALVNNLRYGDSRVRGPAKQSFRRDVCRVRGGLNDQLVVVELECEPLRAQQSRAKRWPRKNDGFKPAPEGFEISEDRKTIPS